MDYFDFMAEYMDDISFAGIFGTLGLLLFKEMVISAKNKIIGGQEAQIAELVDKVEELIPEVKEANKVSTSTGEMNLKLALASNIPASEKIEIVKKWFRDIDEITEDAPEFAEEVKEVVEKIKENVSDMGMDYLNTLIEKHKA